MTNEEVQRIIDAYDNLGNIWKVGETLGIPGQKVHKILTKAGKIHKIRVFTEEEKNVLVAKYSFFAKRGELNLLAEEMGRTKQYLCRKARELGLTGRVHKYALSEEKHQYLSELAKQRILQYGHPRGALGMKQSEKARKKISVKVKAAWQDHREIWCNEKNRRIFSDKMMQMQKENRLGARSRCGIRCVKIGRKNLKLKSRWELCVANYLESLKARRIIAEWEYEPERFEFSYNELGVRSYKPDFVIYSGTNKRYIEVKGWEDEKSKIKKRLMGREYPQIKIYYITSRNYNKIKVRSSEGER